MKEVFNSELVKSLIEISLKEDCIYNDVTSNLAIQNKNKKAKGLIHSKDNFVLCGTPILEKIISLSKFDIEVNVLRKDGENLKYGDKIAQLNGSAHNLLSLERTFLNFLQRLSAIATSTKDFIDSSCGITVYDTRKTTPGYRELEKYATKIGGATNHRQNLSDLILLKNNHIDLASESLSKVLERIFSKKEESIKVEVEVRDFNELNIALKFPVNIIMLDNMNNDDIKESFRIIDLADRRDILVEISGGITKDRMPQLRELGVKSVSTSKLITNASGVDISMGIE